MVIADQLPEQKAVRDPGLLHPGVGQRLGAEAAAFGNVHGGTRVLLVDLPRRIEQGAEGEGRQFFKADEVTIEGVIRSKWRDIVLEDAPGGKHDAGDAQPSRLDQVGSAMHPDQAKPFRRAAVESACELRRHPERIKRIRLPCWPSGARRGRLR